MRSSFHKEEWLGRKGPVCWIMMTVVVFMGGVSSNGPALAGTLEPPPSAVDGAGNPVATGGTAPAWDKVLPANDTGDPCRSSRFTCVMGGQAYWITRLGLYGIGILERKLFSGKRPAAPA